MPNIHGFDTPQLQLRPSDMGPEAMAAAARRGGAFFNQAAEDFGQIGQRVGSAARDVGQVVLDHMDHQQITEGAAMGAQMFDTLTEQKNKIVAGIDPNDPQYGQKVEVALKQWREEQLEPQLQKFGEGFTTEKSQTWAEHFVAQTRNHMFTQTAADISTAAAIGIRNSVRTFQNSASNTAFNDPSAMPGLLAAAEHSITGMVSSSNVKGIDAARIQSEQLEATKEQIVKSAALGYIDKFAKVPSWVSDPQYSKYVSGAELKTFQHNAEARVKANNYYDRQTALVQKQQADLAVHQAAGDIMSTSLTPDPTNPSRLIVAPDAMKKVLDMVRKNPDAPSAAATARTLIDFFEHQQNQRAQPVTDDAVVKSDLIARLGDPNKPTGEIDVLRAAADDKLSPHTTTLLREMVKSMGPDLTHDPLVHSAIDAAKERLGVTTVVDGHERFANFMQAFLPTYLKQKRDGTLPPNWGDLKDPNSLISQSLKAYEPSAAARMQGHLLKSLGATGDIMNPSAPGGGSFRPPANWEWNPKREQYRDPAGNLYDKAGKPVSGGPVVPQSR
jgi:hypothetical protein